MKKLLIAMAFLMAAPLAQAGTTQLRCTNRGNATVVTAQLQFQGDEMDGIGETPVIGTIKVLRFAGREVNKTVGLNGTLIHSAKGPAYELSGRQIQSFVVAAPAADEPSTLAIEGIEQALNCN